MHDWGTTKGFNQVGKIGNRIWSAAAFGGLRCIFQRAGFQRDLLDLLGELNRRERGLRDCARAACVDHFLDVIALMIVRRAGQRNEDRGPSSACQLGNRRCPGPRYHHMRPAKPLRQVRQIGRQLSWNVMGGISGPHRVNILSAALLRNLQTPP